ncbi:tRNA:m(4)X modification enzyme TRM13 [Allomyces javanicus]|nr:tRNA:m(4)X modification enzyme TRM13 [Allomyces javanicus]
MTGSETEKKTTSLKRTRGESHGAADASTVAADSTTTTSTSIESPAAAPAPAPTPTPSASKRRKTKEPPAIPPVPDKPNQCHFLVKRKWRYCSLAARKGKKYCGEHAHLDESESTPDDPRVPCPLDPNHTVQQSRIEEHLTKCNSRVVPAPYRVVDVNLVHEPFTNAVTPLQTRSRDEIAALIAKVGEAYAAMLAEHGPIELVELDHAALDEKKKVKGTWKHVRQQASLVAHLEKIGALETDRAFVEFGAGKGELGHYVQSALTSKSITAPFYTVDRSNFRLKFDRYMAVERLALDIKDLDLAKVESLNLPVVALSKHLCGGATDLTLTCLGHYADAVQPQPGISHVVIALCCHHRCSRETYVGMSWLERFGVSVDEVPVLGQMGGWAICGPERVAATEEGDDCEPEHEVSAEEQAAATAPGEHYSGLTHAEREEIGFMVKRVLDYGRVVWLKERGMDAKLVYYVDRAVSLENCALIAMPKRTAE